MPADGWAICVQLSVFKSARLKLGALYTNPRYSARNEKCLVKALELRSADSGLSRRAEQSKRTG